MLEVTSHQNLDEVLPDIHEDRPDKFEYHECKDTAYLLDEISLRQVYKMRPFPWF